MTSSTAGPRRSPPPTARSAKRAFTGVLRDAFVLLAVALLAPALALGATHDRKPTPAVDIITDGKVVTRANAPAANAIVYLENPATMSIKSYLTGENGEFHFTQLAPQTDYEVWAEQNGLESKQKFISKFSSKTHFQFTLKLEPHGKHKFLGIF